MLPMKRLALTQLEFRGALDILANVAGIGRDGESHQYYGCRPRQTLCGECQGDIQWL